MTGARATGSRAGDCFLSSHEELEHLACRPREASLGRVADAIDETEKRVEAQWLRDRRRSEVVRVGRAGEHDDLHARELRRTPDLGEEVAAIHFRHLEIE